MTGQRLALLLVGALAAGVLGDWAARGTNSVAMVAERHAHVMAFHSPQKPPVDRWNSMPA